MVRAIERKTPSVRMGPRRMGPGGRSLPALAAPGPLDEAQRAGRTEASLPQAGEDFFHDMDNGVALTPDEVKGRNMWLVWTGGDDRFWDQVTKNSLATFDLLKIITSHPSQTYCDGERCDRDSRWRWLGALNEPCFEKPTGPDPKRFGLWLDVRGAELPARSVRGRERSIRASRSARADDVQGRLDAAGRLLLRLRDRHRRPAPVPESRLRPGGEGQVGPRALLHRPELLQDPKLVRPYRVGMACGFCHVGPSPIHPPADPGASAMGRPQLDGRRAISLDGPRVRLQRRIRRTFSTSSCIPIAPGTMDTSLVSTDYINNPRTMNAVYLLGPRLAEAKLWGKETLDGPAARQQAASRLLRPAGRPRGRRAC